MRLVAAVSRSAAIVIALWSGLVAQAPELQALQELSERRRWFELRDAIAGRPAAPLYAGLVASAFNQTRDAERLLQQAVREASTIEQANDAREALVGLYTRHSRSREMLRVLDDMLAAAPARSDVRNVRDGFEPFRNVPDQTARVGSRRPFACVVSVRGVALPGTINGKPVEWLFDSGFSHSALSDSEARRLGVSVLGSSLTAGDFTRRTQTRTAVADRLAIGDSALRHVPMLVFPDTHPMWGDQPPGKRGIVGLPVAVALEGIRWTKNGTCQMGSDSRRRARADANLAFDAESPPVTRVSFDGRMLDMSLDSGAQGGTQLWQRFAVDFPQLVARGTKSRIQVLQIGGPREQEIILLPEMKLRVGGFDAILKPARVFADPGDAPAFHHGNFGMDVFSQPSEVMWDFRAMSVAFR